MYLLIQEDIFADQPANYIIISYITYQKIYIYFREYEDSINLMCHLYEPNLNIGQHSINSKTWELLLNVRFYDNIN